MIRIAENRLRRWSFLGRRTGPKAESQKTHARTLNFASISRSKNAYRTTVDKMANARPPILKCPGSFLKFIKNPKRTKKKTWVALWSCIILRSSIWYLDHGVKGCMTIYR